MKLKPSWNSLALVCKDCRKRSKGPTGMKPKQVLRELRDEMKDWKPRPRVVFAGCLGLCPKRATAVALVNGEGRPLAFAVKTNADLLEVRFDSQAPDHDSTS